MRMFIQCIQEPQKSSGLSSASSVITNMSTLWYDSDPLEMPVILLLVEILYEYSGFLNPTTPVNIESGIKHQQLINHNCNPMKLYCKVYKEKLSN